MNQLDINTKNQDITHFMQLSPNSLIKLIQQQPLGQAFKSLLPSADKQKIIQHFLMNPSDMKTFMLHFDLNTAYLVKLMGNLEDLQAMQTHKSL